MRNSTGETTPMQDSARTESGAQAGWQACTTHAFLLDHRTSCTVFQAIVLFAMTTGWFVYDASNLFCDPSGSVRTGLTEVRSEPGPLTHLSSLLSTTTHTRTHSERTELTHVADAAVSMCAHDVAKLCSRPPASPYGAFFIFVNIHILLC